MNKQIPYMFDCLPASCVKPISDTLSNTGRMSVGVFTKYGNRNGSYITDQYAEYLIETAPGCPVVGFFDRETQDWQGHLGPTLASAYGYVDYFEGWQTLRDADGVERDYAVFSVVVFSDYFEEATHILGKAQSMEINPKTIEGEWAEIDGEEYFVYTTGKMLGFCILGDSHEPCFSASSFFEKQETQFEKFSSLLFELRAKVEEANKEGGEQKMDEVMAPVVEEQVVEDTQASFEEETPVVEEVPTVEEEVVVVDDKFEKLQESYNELKASFDELQTNFNNLQETYNTLNSQYEEATADYEQKIAANGAKIQELNDSLAAANDKLQSYEAQNVERENARKEELVASYEKIISKEEIAPIKEGIADFSYDELESKLAVTYSRKQLKTEYEKVPIPEQEDSAFATLIKKYRK